MLRLKNMGETLSDECMNLLEEKLMNAYDRGDISMIDLSLKIYRDLKISISDIEVFERIYDNYSKDISKYGEGTFKSIAFISRNFSSSCREIISRLVTLFIEEKRPIEKRDNYIDVLIENGYIETKIHSFDGSYSQTGILGYLTQRSDYTRILKLLESGSDPSIEGIYSPVMESIYLNDIRLIDLYFKYNTPGIIKNWEVFIQDIFYTCPEKVGNIKLSTLFHVMKLMPETKWITLFDLTPEQDDTIEKSVTLFDWARSKYGDTSSMEDVINLWKLQSPY